MDIQSAIPVLGMRNDCRFAPQLNVFSFGFPITMTATMLLIYAFAPQLMASFDHLLHEALGLTADMLGAESNG